MIDKYTAIENIATADVSWPEYGARVRVSLGYDYPDNKGTIVNDPVAGLAIVRLNCTRTESVFDVRELRVYLAPSVSAWKLTQRMSVDEVLVKYIELADAMNPDNITYSSAPIFELYRLNYHAEQEVYYGLYEETGPAAHLGIGPAVDPDKYSHDEDWGADDEQPDQERGDVYCTDVYWPVTDADGGWESGTCDDEPLGVRDERRRSTFGPQDDGYGYPVYRVED